MKMPALAISIVKKKQKSVSRKGLKPLLVTEHTNIAISMLTDLVVVSTHWITCLRNIAMISTVRQKGVY